MEFLLAAIGIAVAVWMIVSAAGGTATSRPTSRRASDRARRRAGQSW